MTPSTFLTAAKIQPTLSLNLYGQSPPWQQWTASNLPTSPTSARQLSVWSNLYKSRAVGLSSPTSIGTDRHHNPLPSPDWADRSSKKVHSTKPNSLVSVRKLFGWSLQHSDQSRGPRQTGPTVEAEMNRNARSTETNE